MEESEKRIRQEDCSEDTISSGILTLTNKRVAFDKRGGRIMDFSMKFGETVVDIPLNDIVDVWKEGRFIKKVCIKAKIKDSENIYKFGVFNTGSWLKTLQETIEENKNQ